MQSEHSRFNMSKPCTDQDIVYEFEWRFHRVPNNGNTGKSVASPLKYLVFFRDFIEDQFYPRMK